MDTEGAEENIMSTSVEEMLAMGSKLLQLTTDSGDAGPVDMDKPSSRGEQSVYRSGRNPCPFSEAVPQKYSWTGRSQYAEKGGDGGSIAFKSVDSGAPSRG